MFIFFSFIESWLNCIKVLLNLRFLFLQFFLHFQIIEAVRIILTVRDEAKDKNIQVEMGWVGSVTKGLYQPVPAEVTFLSFVFP